MSTRASTSSMKTSSRSRTILSTGGETCCSDTWEAAYSRFETPEQEIHKFIARLKKLGAKAWPREAQIVELFCGRGGGCEALARLGFQNIEGIDLSPTLVAQYRGQARLHVGDCRRLPFADQSKDIAIVQGGLHHLPVLPRDLEQTLAEARRVLRPGGLFAAVEPWLTPFLSFVHTISAIGLVQRLSPKLEALQTMIRHEQVTYDAWLGRPREILPLFEQHFVPQQQSRAWGKLMFVGTKRA
jgi:SAM-dependent methyltransferase